MPASNSRNVIVGEVGIIPSDAAEPLGTRRHVDDLRTALAAQGWQQGRHQLEMAEVIGR